MPVSMYSCRAGSSCELNASWTSSASASTSPHAFSSVRCQAWPSQAAMGVSVGTARLGSSNRFVRYARPCLMVACSRASWSRASVWVRSVTAADGFVLASTNFPLSSANSCR